jgi:hypothetical protein
VSTFEYIHSDVPPGMDLREYRRTLARRPRRRLHLQLPHVTLFSRAS